jgi:hypothetical protein
MRTSCCVASCCLRDYERLTWNRKGCMSLYGFESGGMRRLGAGLQTVSRERGEEEDVDGKSLRFGRPRQSVDILELGW